MKIIFYRKLLEEGVYSDLTPNQKIAFSFLLSKSLTYNTSFFLTDGSGIDIYAIQEYYSEEEKIALDLIPINVQNTAKALNMSRRSLQNAITELRGRGLITDEEIYTDIDVITSGYFELKTETGLSKLLLILYSWLYERSKCYDFVVDTYEKTIANKTGLTTNNVGQIVKRLTDLGLAKRLRNPNGSYGKLQILR